MIGMSVYPYWAEQAGETGGWQKVADDCIANINHLKEKYGKPVMICEIGMPYDQGRNLQGAHHYDDGGPMSKACSTGNPRLPGGYNDGYNMGCFDNGAPTVALTHSKPVIAMNRLPIFTAVALSGPLPCRSTPKGAWSLSTKVGSSPRGAPASP